MATKYKQQSDGRWHTRVWDGTYIEGKKHYVKLTSAKSSKDLERMVTEYTVKRENGQITVSANMSIQEYAREWLRTSKGLSQKATKAMYTNVIEVHLKRFNTLTFEFLTKNDIQVLIYDNQNSPRTCQQISMTLKQICKSAEERKLLPAGETEKMFYKLQKPTYKAKEKKPLTNTQWDKVYDTLVAHTLPPRSSLFLSLIYFCGIRREEALALKLEDIHQLSIDINKALHISDNEVEMKPTKTLRGQRTIPLPQRAILIIQSALGEITPSCDGYLFTMKDGRLITKSSYRRMWDGIQKALGFECTAHIFRHTYCTRLCYESYHQRTISIKQIAYLLGDTEKMVTDVYGHLMEEQEQTAKALKNVFSTAGANTKRTPAANEN